MIRAGILSDTHLEHPTEALAIGIAQAFQNCDLIFHAGDITDSSILRLFSGKVVHAVHGNCCNQQTTASLPMSKTVVVEGFTIALCHGAGGPRHTIEDRMWTLFPEAECIIFGHTHQPLCQTYGETLFINPGSFHCAPGGRGTPASYALLTIDQTQGLSAELHQLQLP